MQATCGLWNPKVTEKKRWIVLAPKERTVEMKAQTEERLRRDREASRLRHPLIAHDLAKMDREHDEREAAKQHGDFYFMEHNYEIELTLKMINQGFEHKWPTYNNMVLVQKGLEIVRHRDGRRVERYRQPIRMPYLIGVNIDYRKKASGWLTNYVHPRTMKRLQDICVQLDLGPAMLTTSNICRAKDLFHDETPVFAQMDKNSSIGFMTEEAALLFAGMVESGMMDDEYDRWKRT